MRKPSLKVIKSALSGSPKGASPLKVVPKLSKFPARSRRIAKVNTSSILNLVPISRLNTALSSLTAPLNFKRVYVFGRSDHPLPFYRNGRFVSRGMVKRRRYFRSSGFRFLHAKALFPLRPDYRPLGKGTMLLDGHVAFVSRSQTTTSLSHRHYLGRLSSRLHRLRKLGDLGLASPWLTETRLSSQGEMVSEPRLSLLSGNRHLSGFAGSGLTTYLAHRYLGVKKNLSFFVGSWLEGLTKMTSNSSIFVASYQTFSHSSPSLFQP